MASGLQPADQTEFGSYRRCISTMSEGEFSVNAILIGWRDIKSPTKPRVKPPLSMMSNLQRMAMFLKERELEAWPLWKTVLTSTKG